MLRDDVEESFKKTDINRFVCGLQSLNGLDAN